MSTSLRSQLGAPSDPEFTMMLPAGWARMDASRESRDELIARARTRLSAAQRPDLYAAARASLTRAFDALERTGALAVMLQVESGDGVPFIPASVTAATHTATADETLDEFVAGLIQRGATPLGDDKRFIRLEERELHSDDGVQLGVTTVRYLTPVPRSGRRRALLLTAVLPHEPETPDDDPLLVATKFTIDAHVSTLRWLPPAPAAAEARA